MVNIAVPQYWIVSTDFNTNYKNYNDVADTEAQKNVRRKFVLISSLTTEFYN